MREREVGGEGGFDHSAPSHPFHSTSPCHRTEMQINPDAHAHVHPCVPFFFLFFCICVFIGATGGTRGLAARTNGRISADNA